MAYSFEGIGTTFYGQCDWRRDGSFCTTKWVVVFWIPLFPLTSHRLRRNWRPNERGFLGYSTGYYVIENLPIDFNQVLRTYMFAIFHLAWCPLSFWICHEYLPLEAYRLPLQFVLVLVYVVAAYIPFLMVVCWRLCARLRAATAAGKPKTIR